MHTQETNKREEEICRDENMLMNAGIARARAHTDFYFLLLIIITFTSGQDTCGTQSTFVD